MSIGCKVPRVHVLRKLTPVLFAVFLGVPALTIDLDQPPGEPTDRVPALPSSTEQPSVTWVHVVILGLVEGVTEYLPVSSTGHLILAQRAMGLVHSDASNAFAICIQAGAIAAVLLLYFHRIRQIFRSVLGRDEQDRRIAINILVAFLPAAVVGLLFDEMIERHLFGVKPVVAAWFAGGLFILLVARWQRRASVSGYDLDQLAWRAALIIGLAQCLALWPGTSRSLATILGGVLVGLSLPAAVEFSFLLGMVTLGAATAYKGLQHGPTMVETYGWLNLLVGFLVATVSAAIAIKWMVAYLTNHGLEIFGYYRLLLAAVVGVLVIIGVI